MTQQQTLRFYRAKEEARYIIDTDQTVRETGKYFGVGKSTVFLDVTTVLKDNEEFELYDQVQRIFKTHHQAQYKFKKTL